MESVWPSVHGVSQKGQVSQEHVRGATLTHCIMKVGVNTQTHYPWAIFFLQDVLRGLRREWAPTAYSNNFTFTSPLLTFPTSLSYFICQIIYFSLGLLLRRLLNMVLWVDITNHHCCPWDGNFLPIQQWVLATLYSDFYSAAINKALIY